MAKRDGDCHLPKQQTVQLPATMRPTRAPVKARRQREATLFTRSKSSVAVKRVRDRNRGRDTKQQLLQQAATIEEQKDLIEKQHLALVLAEEQLMKMQNARDHNQNTLQTATPSDQLLVVHQLEERVFGADRLSYRSIGMSESLFNDFPGNANNQKKWNESRLRPLLEGKQYGIIRDMGYTFNRLVDSVSIQGFSPKKKQRGQLHHDAITKEKNVHISSIRIQIEHYFARLKAWRILKGVFRHFSALGHNILDFDVIVHCIASLIEWLRSKPFKE
jgi:hypothetical protein